MKRTMARSPLQRGEQLQDKIEAQLAAIKRTPALIRSFFLNQYASVTELVSNFIVACDI